MTTADATAPAAIERLLAVQACHDVVVRAATCVDAGDADRLAMIFTEDAVLVRPGAEPLRGRAAIRHAYAQRPAERVTRHLLTNVRVDVESCTQARVRSLVLLWTGSSADADGPSGREAHARQWVGEFDDQLLRDAHGVWLIQRRDARFVLHRDGNCTGTAR
jgi:uncharacterized protein (TIGR02246 family)